MVPDVGALHPSLEIRRAGGDDIMAIAAAHLNSINTIGLDFYPPDIVKAWGARVTGRMYLDAMARGEVFFVAVERRGSESVVLGFSSHHAADGEHGVGVYVRGAASRRGIGSALLRAAEASARAAGATRLTLDASLAAVEFYKAHGFVEMGRGAHALGAGVSMACVFMQKMLNE